MNIRFKKPFLTLFTLCLFAFVSATTKDWKTSPEKTFVFELTTEQAQRLFESSRKDTLIESMLGEPIAWFQQEWKEEPDKGHFVHATINKNRVHFKYSPVIPYQVFLFKEHGALTLQVVDGNGDIRTDAIVSIKEDSTTYTRVPYVAETKTYSVRENSQEHTRLLLVELDGFTSFMELEKNLVNRYFREYHSTGSIRRSTNQPTFFRYLITDKNKYKPGESVRFKMYALDGNKRPLTEKLSVWVEGFDWKYKEISTISCNHPGNYTGEIFLHDSLELKLDRKYGIQLRNEKSVIIGQASFLYEEYELLDGNIDVLMQSYQHFFPENNEIIIHATDANGLPLPEAKATISIVCTGIQEVYSKFFSIPYVVYTDKIELSSTEATRVPIPAYLFGQSNCNYQVQVSVETLDKQTLTRNFNVNFFYNHYSIQSYPKGNKICFELYKLGKPVPGKAILQYDSEKESHEISLPYEEPFNQKHSYYYLQIPELQLFRTIYPSWYIPGFKLDGTFSDGVFHARLENPVEIDCSWYIYAGNELLAKGSGTQLDVKIPQTNQDAVHLVEIFYHYGGEEEVYRKSFSPQKDDLNISTNLPARIYPGQTWETLVQVKDRQGNPVKDVDLTAFSVNSLLNYDVPDLPYFGASPQVRQKQDEYEIEESEFSFSIPLSWPFWKKHAGLDSMEYYRFIYPYEDVFSYTEPSPDGITQFAPFVMKNGEAMPIYVIECEGEPIWFSWTHHIQGYSFPVKSDSRQSISLRLYDRTIILPMQRFQEGMKTILSVDIDHLPENAVEINAYENYSIIKERFSKKEKERYQRYISRVPNDRARKFIYMKQGKNIYPIHYKDFSYHANSHFLIGPYPPGFSSWIDGIEYRHEGGYKYDYEGNVIYKQPESDQIPSSLSSRTNNQFNELHDFYISADSIYRFLNTPKTTKKEPIVYWQPANYRLIHGKLNLNLQLISQEIPVPIAGIVLYNRTDHSIMHQANELYYSKLPLPSTPDGMYDVILLYQDGQYVRAENIPISPAHYIYIDMRELSVQPKDKVSAGWAELFNKEKYGPPIDIEEMTVTEDSQDYTQSSLSKRKKVFSESVEKFTTTGKDISGEVYDSYGDALIGASIVIKGTTTGTVANLDGKFKLNLPKGNPAPPYRIVISYVGYITIETDVQPGTHLKIVMEEDMNTLDDVVVTGYGTTRRMSMTGAVSPVTSALEGQAAGVTDKETRTGKVPKLTFTSDDEHIEEGKEPTYFEDSDVSEEAEAQLYLQLLLLNGLRSNFSDVGFWEPVLYTDKKGEASFTVTFPDNITKWNTVIYGMNQKLQTGTLRHNIQSWKPLMGELKTPQFLVVGDTAYAAATIRNYTNDKPIEGSISYVLNADTLQDKTVRFDGLWEQRLLMTSSKTDSLNGTFLFTRSDGYQDGEKRVLPVIPTGTEVAEGNLQILKNGDVIELTTTEGEEIFVNFTSRPLEVYLEAVGYLLNYKYACNEQLASKLSGLIHHKYYCEYKDMEFPYDKQVNEIITRLLNNQNKNQLWSWWGNNVNSSLWMSAHILRSLKKARDAGYTVNLDVSQTVEAYLYHAKEEEPDFPIDLLHALSAWTTDVDYEEALDIYEKTIHKRENEFYIDSGGEKRFYNRSYLTEKLLVWEIRQQQGLPYSTDSIAKYLHTDMMGTIVCDDLKQRSYRNNSRRLDNTLIAYRIVSNDPVLHEYKEAMQMYILGTKKGFWNTYQSANIISAILPDLLAENTHSDVQAVVLLSGQEDMELSTFPYQTVIRDGQKLRIEKKEGLPVFCSYHKTERKTKGYNGEAFDIRTYFRETGDVLVAGQPTTLWIDVEVKQDNSEYIMIEIPLPAGCSYASKTNNRYSPYEVHREHFKEKTVIFCEKLGKGNYTFQVVLLPRFTGQYHLNPAKIELMYQPVIHSLNDMRKVDIIKSNF